MITMNQWILESSQDGSFLYITRDDRPGFIKVFNDDDHLRIRVYPDIENSDDNTTLSCPWGDLTQFIVSTYVAEDSL